MCSPAERAASPGCAPGMGHGCALPSRLHGNHSCSRFSDTRCFWTLSRDVLHALRWQQTNKEQLTQISSWHFFGLETYLTLMQIFYQKSTESLPQIGLHLTEQCYGAVPCSYMLAGSKGKWGAVLGPEGSAPWGLFLNCNGFCLQYSEFRAFKWGCCVGAQRDGNSSAVVIVLGEMGGWQCYQEGWCLFPDTFMEFLTIV